MILLRQKCLISSEPEGVGFVTGGEKLAELAGAVNAEHRRCETAIRESLAHALKAGELLIEAKKLLPHGEWAGWLVGNCEFSERTAQAYMRLARGWPELGKTQRVADLSFREAIGLLAVPRGEIATYENYFALVFELLGDLEAELEGAETLEEVNSIIKLSEQVYNQVTEVKLRLQRKVGDLLARLMEQKK